ncbi:AMP-binding protein [Amycolatopsis sp. YIM 10]|uniref:AMP-binding protein n=1 Tax=Amycolatopsis sp. YIM 10 TaxID=2653857 RepID=UPI0012900B15|nr:AMP-binding protein [Amycolatopsis sp. YIM 10]QFU89547.1 Long-chain-fatty-acid--CoA ligase FadD13 [Amycolatopsis sp. YIM 10]
MGPFGDASTITLGDVLREHRRSRGGLTATVDHAVRLSYAEFDHRVNKLANALAAHGAGPGERVLWLGQNSFRLLELLGACAKLGAAVVPVNWRQSAGELAVVIDDVAARVVVWQDTEIGATVRAAREQAATAAGSVWVRHDAAGPGSYEEFLAAGDEADPDIEVDAASPVLGIYTAAFEGRPHAAMLSHWSALIEGLVVGRIAELSDATVFLNSGPMFHLGTLMTTLATLVHGGTNVIVARVDPEEMCAVIEAERCNRAFVMAPTLEAIREINAGGRFDLTSLWPDPDPATWTMCTPSANPATGRAGGYGQSEVSGLITSYGLGRKSDSIYGRPAPLSQVRIVDDTGADVPDGETGEIICRGPVVMTGYLHRDELNAQRRRGGWHYTGDLGKRAPDGSIQFVGPKLRMIKSASENIYPFEVERCLTAHPGVAAACVIGVPDERWTQSVKAVVVRAEGSTVTAEELVEHCRRSIASYKKPRVVVFVDALPKQANGQVDRDRVDAEHGGGGYPGQVSSGRRDVPLRAGAR